MMKSKKLKSKKLNWKQLNNLKLLKNNKLSKKQPPSIIKLLMINHQHLKKSQMNNFNSRN
jgi:hypothetical protein